MDRIRPIKYKVDWTKIPYTKLLENMEVFRLSDDDIRKSRPDLTDKELKDFKNKGGTGSGWNQNSYSKIVRVANQNLNSYPELEKIFTNFGYGCMDYISFVELPAGTGYPPHRDAYRSCNINFIMPNGSMPIAPLILNGNVYNYDRFVFDPQYEHEVPAVNTTRFTMMLTYTTASFEKITGLLKRDGWM